MASRTLRNHSKYLFHYVLVCGGRYFKDCNHVAAVLSSIKEKLTKENKTMVVVTGGSSGADSLAADWADSVGVRCVNVPAAWVAFKKSAGPIRNTWMLELFDIDEAVAFPGGAGTANMVTLLEKRNIPTQVYE